MQLSAFADAASAVWELEIDGRRLNGDREPADDLIPIRFPTLEPGSFASARLLAVWLSDASTVTLSARRPAGARGQDQDAIEVALSPQPEDQQIFDPRLSTEYSAAGVPRRFGIELWLGTDPDGDQRPMRVGGERREDAATASQGSVSVLPMRARRGDVDGFGLYVFIDG